MSERIEIEATNLMVTTGQAAFECEPSQPIGDQRTEREYTASRKVQESDQKRKNSKRIVLTPLSLLVLAACGGGDSNGTDNGDGPGDGLSSLFGRVVKGPLENAFVFADTNGNGSFDLGEPSSTTDSGGRFTLERAGSATIIATTSANTIDQSSGVALDGLTLSAPAGATVVTPVTSIIAQSGGALTPTQVAQILGLPAGIDPLEYDPYAQGTDNAEAAKVEVIAQQLVATVRSFAAVAEGTGVTEDEALSAAFSAVVQLVASKGADGATKLVDFTSAEDISAISQAVAGNLLALDEQGDRSLNIDLFDDLADVTSSALINVNAVIDTTVTQVVETGGSLSSDEVRNALSTTQILQQQLEEASQAEAEAPGTGSQSIVFSVLEKVSEAVQNASPESISLSQTEIVENAQDLFVGTLSAVDDADLPENAFSIVKHGTHWQYFEIREDNKLFLKQVADFESTPQLNILIDVTDAGGKTLRKSFTITVTNANDAPVGAVTITGTATQGEVLTANTSTLADDDGLGTLNYQWKADGTNISGALASTFTLTQAEVGKVITVAVSYTDGGGTLETVTSAATPAVTNVNDLPVGVADTLAATEDTAVTYDAVDLLGNDTDADGDTLSIKSVTAITGGTAVLNQDGTVTFTPTANFNGAASFSYIATDGTADAAATTVTVNVAAVNDAPVGVADTLAATEDTAVTYNTADILGNDTDADGDTLSIRSVTSGTGGTAILNQNGTVTFTPTANFNGAASFSYIATDGTADTAATTVTVNVAAVNDAPVIVSGATGSVAENAQTSTVIYTAQASDVDNATTLTYSLGGADASLLDIDPSTGAVTLKASANFEVKSSYSFNVIATDNGTGSLSDTKAVSVSVTDVNEAPTAVGTVAAQTAVNGQLFSLDVHGYFADVDAGNNGTLTYSATGLPSGITIDSSTGVISGTASADRSSAEVVVTATDGGSLFATQSFNLGVVSAPIITGLASNVAVAKSGDALTFTATVSEAVIVNTNGGIPTLTLDVGGQTLTATYSGGSGTTSLTFTATAGAGNDSTVSVTAINLSGGTITGNTTAQGLLTTATGQVVPSFIVDNTNPSFTSGATASFAENGSGTAYASAVTDATTVTYTLGGTDAALFDISGTGAVTFKTAPDFEAAGDNGSNNVYDVTVTATDAAGNQNSQAVTITVTNVNEAPSITSGATASFAENDTGTVYTATATDPDAGTTLVYTLGGTDANLFDIDASTGVVTFKSAPNFEAPADAGANNVYDISVTATDNGTGSLSDTKAVAITVTNVNDAPVGTTDTLAATEDTAVTYDAVDLLGNDTDADGDTLTIKSVNSITGGTAVLNQDGTVTFTPTANFNGAASFSYIATDGTADTETTTVTVNVEAVNDTPIGSVTISGTPTQGQTLTANNTLADADGLGTLNYTWKSGGVAIAGATASTYTLTQAEVGKAITVEISYTDNQGTLETVASTATAAIVNVNDAPSGAVKITGAATEGEALTANTSALVDADGLGTFSYQWKANGSDIAGATDSTYTLTQAEVGKVITVAVSYTDDEGTSENVLSAASDAVLNVNNAPTGSVTILGSALDGSIMLAANTNGLIDPDGLGEFFYQWKANGSNLPLENRSTLKTSKELAAATITVDVSYSDKWGTLETVTSNPINLGSLAWDSSRNVYIIPDQFVRSTEIDGLSNYDIVSFQNLSVPIYIDLGAQTRVNYNDKPFGIERSVLGESIDFIRWEKGASIGEADLRGVEKIVATKNNDVAQAINIRGRRMDLDLGDGNDYLTIGPRITSDTLDGGAGDDTINVYVSGFEIDLKNETMTLGSSSSKIANFENIDFVQSGTFIGNDAANVIKYSGFFGTPERDILQGNGGFDNLDGGDGGDLYYVNDIQHFFSGEISDSGTSGTDELRFNLSVESYVKLGPAESVIEIISIGSGFSSTPNRSSTVGVNIDASDVPRELTIHGSLGSNTITGTRFSDSLYGYGGNDSLIGGLGDDQYYGLQSDDNVTEKQDQGIDTVYPDNLKMMPDNVERMIIQPSATGAEFYGNAMGNFISIEPSDVSRTIHGNQGNDFIVDRGNSLVHGGEGDDFFYIISGFPVSIADFEPDVWDQGQTSQGDIFNYIVDSGDSLVFSALSMTGLDYNGSLADKHFLSQNNTSSEINSETLEHRILYNEATGELFNDKDGSGPIQKTLIATLENKPALETSDFFLLSSSNLFHTNFDALVANVTDW